MTQPTSERAPEWPTSRSPVGTQIAFYAYPRGNREMRMTPVLGRPTRWLHHNEPTDSSPAWSPDAREIAFTSGRSDAGDVLAVSSTVAEPRQFLSFSWGEGLAGTWVMDVVL